MGLDLFEQARQSAKAINRYKNDNTFYKIREEDIIKVLKRFGGLMMDEIFGWVLTCHNGNLSIEYKEMENVLLDDLGYTDVSYNEDVSYSEQSWYEDSLDDSPLYVEDSVDDSPLYVEDSVDEDYLMSAVSEQIDDTELEEVMRFFVDGYEIESQGDTMVFLLDEKTPDISERALEKLSNLNISR